MSQTPDQARVFEWLYAAVDEVNQQLRKAQRIDKSPGTLLTGEGGLLDSLGMLNLLVAIERRLEQQLGVSVTLADEESLSQDPSPFRSLSSLAEHIQRVVLRKQPA